MEGWGESAWAVIAEGFTGVWGFTAMKRKHSGTGMEQTCEGRSWGGLCLAAASAVHRHLPHVQYRGWSWVCTTLPCPMKAFPGRCLPCVWLGSPGCAVGARWPWGSEAGQEAGCPRCPHTDVGLRLAGCSQPPAGSTPHPAAPSCALLQAAPHRPRHCSASSLWLSASPQGNGWTCPPYRKASSQVSCKFPSFS